MRAVKTVAAGVLVAATVFACAIDRKQPVRVVDPAFCDAAVEIEALGDDVQRITRHSVLVKTEAWKTGQGIEVIERDYADCVTKGKTK